jgi:signal transduction histidine kinase
LNANDPSDRASSNAVTDALGEIDQLCRLAEALDATLDVSELAERSLDPLLAMSRAVRALIYLSSEQDPALTPAASRSWTDVPRLEADDLTPLEAEAYRFERAEDLPPALRPLLLDGQGPIAVAPLRVHSRLLGVVVLGRDDRPFDEAALKLLTAGVRTLALAVENSKLFEDLESSYKELMNAQAGVIRSERFAALGQLSATLAHEIRNPLATIFSAISQIRKHGKPNETQDTLLDIAEEEAARLNHMVTGLLDFARPRQPVFEEGRPLEIALAVVRALQEDEQIPPGVELTIDDSSDPTTRLDTDLVQKAITHLLKNAIAAVDHDGGKIKLSVTRPPGRPEGALIEVADDGPGIPAESIPRVLEPFYSTSPSGTGLGLPTLKRIAEDHRGALEIDSHPGTGTVVRLLLDGGDLDATDQEAPR